MFLDSTVTDLSTLPAKPDITVMCKQCHVFVDLHLLNTHRYYHKALEVRYVCDSVWLPRAQQILFSRWSLIKLYLLIRSMCYLEQFCWNTEFIVLHAIFNTILCHASFCDKEFLAKSVRSVINKWFLKKCFSQFKSLKVIYMSDSPYLRECGFYV